ncbi:MAG: asparagine synthase (glutamine-hydrolyzing) [Pseudomonadota bacterium]
MCGIAGFFDPRGTWDEVEARRRLEAMGQAIAYRGPDSSGCWVEKGSIGGAQLGLSHRRLAIVDLSPTGQQPMVSQCGRYAIVYNGEIYNHPDLRQQLDETPSLKWNGTSDTETLLALITRYGIQEAIEKCDGMFAFAVWDRELAELTLARDAFGEKPLTYGLWQGVLLFGSELSALRAWPGFAAAEDTTALAEYFAYSVIPAPRTIYDGIYKLPPGHLLRINGPTVEAGTLPSPVQWFDPVEAALSAQADPFQGDYQDAVDAVRKVMLQSTKRRLMSDVPLGALLSGGVDSTLTTALMQELSDTPVRTFTIGFDEHGYDESRHAEKVARHLDTNHETQMLSANDVQDTIPFLAAHCDEPFADSSLLPTFIISKVARQRVTVALSGDGGDEMFGGYNRYMFGPDLWARISRLPIPLRRSLGLGLGSVPPGMLTALFNRLPHSISGSLTGGRAGEQLHKVSRLLNSGDRPGFHESLLRVNKRLDLLSSREPFSPITDRLDTRIAGSSFCDSLMVFDLCHYLPNDVLSKVDRASMATSLETRTPFLNRQVMDLAWSLPKDHKIGAGTGKRVLRSLIDDYIPRELMERPKAGFALPIGRWLRGPLSDWAEGLLSHQALSSSELLNERVARKLWAEHKSGRKVHESTIWSLLMYQSWRANLT